ncbi:MAG: recombinase family protein [Elainella sp. Prado103]|jgi:DNA invertase Pin-like site-specific DNA recombinase|nr:recombinase family protein [Elainella sp. Prado103]
MPSPFGKVVAYTYSDPLLESVPELSIPGWSFDWTYQDQGDRQQWQQLLQDAQQTPVAQVVIRFLAELGTSLAELGDRLADLAALNIQLVVLETSDRETSDRETSDRETSDRSASPVALLDQLSGLSQTTWQDLDRLASHRQSQQLQRGHALNRLKALPPPGKAPYGYRRGRDRYLLDRSTAPVVKDFFEHFLLYGSLRASVRYLQKKYGKRISVSTGKRWLTSPVYRGDLSYQTGDVIRDTHGAILSREEAAQVDRLLRRNQGMPPRTASSPRSLSGLVRCATCGSAMKMGRVARSSGSEPREYLYLRPVKCPLEITCPSLAYQTVLDQTIQQICQDLPAAVNQAQIPDVDQLRQRYTQQLTSKQAILDQLPQLQREGILDKQTVDLRAYTLRSEMAALQTQISQLPPLNLKAIVQVVSIPQFWFDLSESERRFYFREFIRQIQIDRQAEHWRIRLVFIF